MRKLTLLIIVFMLLIPFSFADSLILNYTQVLSDGDVFDAVPNTNSGTGEFMRTYKGTIRAYVIFDLSLLENLGVTADDITEARWRGKNIQFDGFSAVEARSYEVNATWDELVLTWNNQPCATASNNPFLDNVCSKEYSFNQSAVGINETANLDITSIVKNQFARGNISFVILTDEDTLPNSGQYYRTKESSILNETHFINVTYSIAPAPPAVQSTLFSSDDASNAFLAFMVTVLLLIGLGFQFRTLKSK